MNNNQLVVGVTSFCAILITVVAAASGLTTLSAESSTSSGIDGSTNGGLSGGSLTNSFLSMLTTTPSSENSTGTTSGNLTSSFLSMLTTTPSSENSTSPYTTTTASTSPSCDCTHQHVNKWTELFKAFGYCIVILVLWFLFGLCIARITGASTRTPSPPIETMELLSMGDDGQNFADDGGEGPSGEMNTQPTSGPKGGTGEEKGPDNSDDPTSEHKKRTRKTRHLETIV